MQVQGRSLPNPRAARAKHVPRISRTADVPVVFILPIPRPSPTQYSSLQPIDGARERSGPNPEAK